MIIGGFDIMIPTPRNAMVVLIKLIKSIWSDAVVVEDTVDEVFVFQNAEIAKKWDELGAEPELADTMIHIIVKKKETTLVVDNPESDLTLLLRGLLKSL